MDSNHNQGLAADINTLSLGNDGQVLIIDNTTPRGWSWQAVTSTTTQPYWIHVGSGGYKALDEALKAQGGFTEEQPEEEGYNYLKMIKVINKDEKSKSND